MVPINCVALFIFVSFHYCYLHLTLLLFKKSWMSPFLIFLFYSFYFFLPRFASFCLFLLFFAFFCFSLLLFSVVSFIVITYKNNSYKNWYIVVSKNVIKKSSGGKKQREKNGTKKSQFEEYKQLLLQKNIYSLLI